jgi:hypothetical protein
MLSDLLPGFRAHLSPSLRGLGYLDETLAMRRRSQRNRHAWLPHLDNTRKFVLSAADRCRKRRKVAVLGSGLLLDVPLAELADLFNEVALMDVVCLPEARREIRQYPNTRFIEHDVTGVADQLYRQRGHVMTALSQPAADTDAFDDADLVVSLNILSQLWVVPRAFVSRHFPCIAPEIVDEWCRGIVERHYASLRSLPCEVCLVGDHAHVKRDREGAVVSRGSTVFDLHLPGPDASWSWNIVPIGTDSPHTSKELIVGGWHFQ